MTREPAWAAAITRDATLRARTVEALRKQWGDPVRAETCCDDAVRIVLTAATWHHATDAATLSWACSHGHLSVVECLLAVGVDVHADHDDALRSAVAYGHLPVVERLLGAGADVHAGGKTALSLAAMHGRRSIAVCLLAAGARVHGDHEAALYQAVCNGYEDIVALLFAAGADVHADGDKMLGVALAQSRRGMVCRLLHHGADASAGWYHLTEPQKRNAAAILNAMAADIHADQRRKLVDMSPRRFPALRSLLAAEQRQVDAPRSPSKRMRGSL